MLISIFVGKMYNVRVRLNLYFSLFHSRRPKRATTSTADWRPLEGIRCGFGGACQGAAAARVQDEFTDLDDSTKVAENDADQPGHHH